MTPAWYQPAALVIDAGGLVLSVAFMAWFGIRRRFRYRGSKLVAILVGYGVATIDYHARILIRLTSWGIPLRFTGPWEAVWSLSVGLGFDVLSLGFLLLLANGVATVAPISHPTRTWDDRPTGTRRPMTRAQWIKLIGPVAGLLLTLGIIVATDDGVKPTPTTTTTSSTTTLRPATGTPVLKVDVSTHPADPRSRELVANLLLPGADLIPQFGTRPAGTNYPIGVVDKATANVRRRIFHKCLDFNCALGAFPQELKGTTIDWNDQWRPPDGNDGFMVITDSQGHEWDLWNASFPGYQTPQNNSWGCALAPSFNVNADICALSYLPITDPNGVLVDTRTYLGNAPAASGGGIQNLSGLMSAADVLAGRCQSIKTMATNTTYGPTGAPAVAPAGQWERSAGQAVGGAQQAYTDAQSVPEGTRFVLKFTATEKTARLAKFTGAKREFESKLIDCLSTTGFIITDTFGYGPAAMQFRWDYTNPGQYAAVGVDGTGADLLAGLFTTSNLVAVAPPTSTCVDGRVTTAWCWAREIAYR